MLQVLRSGIRHPHVLLWEEFLRGTGHYMVEVDEVFDDPSVEATKAFQEEHGLQVDGWVGGQTWGAAIQLGLDVLVDDTQDREGPNWPPRPADLEPLNGNAERAAKWGDFSYRAAGTEDNPEAIHILGDWVNDNIVGLSVPSLRAVQGVAYRDSFYGKGPRKVFVHRLVADSFEALWQAWDDEGLLGRIFTFDGSWVPRFVRGSRSTLSNHSYGTAFDINASWNGLRRVPALLGKKGCVRELVEIANKYGWWWGGHGWPKNYDKLDGMHFEHTGQGL